MNPGFAAYLAKKNNKGGLSGGNAVAPGQPAMSEPTVGVKNTQFEKLNTTKAQVATRVPQGKSHAKVIGAPKNLKHGKYL